MHQEEEDLRPPKVHEPSSVFANGLKLLAKLKVQPSTIASHEPSSMVALSWKLNAAGSVQPATSKVHEPSSWFASVS